MFNFLQKKSFWTILITALLLLVIMKLSSSNRQEITVLEKLLRDSYSPLQTGVDKLKIGINQISVGMAHKKEIEEQMVALETKNNLLSLENQQLRENKAEVERLRSLLAYKQAQQDQYDLEAARVIARSPNNWYKIITIDKGAENGIAGGMPVINPDGLVGRVVSVSTNSAQILLITDREMAVGAILQETRETRGIVEGMGDSGTLRMINIPYYSQVRVGENVVSSGLSETYPPGIHIGSIQVVTKESNGLVLSATVSPAVDFNQLEEVLVIKKYRQVEANGNKGA
ncbi:MAG: rod shape-determining protein MreC [Firmicutes bacterium HGW-Firmicutes-15]|nr:MAG: rod shape-determining protein MreC [Firmicutes bacterium HGW-Firmicutes-15]